MRYKRALYIMYCLENEQERALKRGDEFWVQGPVFAYPFGDLYNPNILLF